MLNWFFSLPAALSILIVSILVSLLSSLAMKFLTNQNEMKSMRKEMKDFQKKMSDAKNDPKKLAKLNERMMEINMKYMNSSMKPTLFTLLPLLFIFSWMSGHLAYYPLMPGEEFSLTSVYLMPRGEAQIIVPKEVTLLEPALKNVTASEVSWKMTAPAGKYDLTVLYDGRNYTKKVQITDERSYENVVQQYKKKGWFTKDDGTNLDNMYLSNREVKPFADVPLIKEIPWVNTWGWLGAYILFSLLGSLAWKKVLDIA